MANQATAAPESRFLTIEQLADRYQVSVQTVRDWRRLGTGPVVTKVGGLVRFAIADVATWERERREASA